MATKYVCDKCKREMPTIQAKLHIEPMPGSYAVMVAKLHRDLCSACVREIKELIDGPPQNDQSVHQAP